VGTNNAKIEKANYDGSDRKTIINERLGESYGLTVDTIGWYHVECYAYLLCIKNVCLYYTWNNLRKGRKIIIKSYQNRLI